MFNKQKQAESTALTAAQREAIKKVENYWLDRIRNMNHWKVQKHFTWKRESISTRVESTLYQRLKDQDKSRLIRNFARKFLRDPAFRGGFMGRLDSPDMFPTGIKKNCSDVTEFLSLLTEDFPYTVSGWIPNVEKELLTLYFTFCTRWSLSWALRCSLCDNLESGDQHPILPEEVPYLIQSIIGEVK